MATQLIFSFDSEDYITPEAADAEQWWAEAMIPGITRLPLLATRDYRNSTCPTISSAFRIW